MGQSVAYMCERLASRCGYPREVTMAQCAAPSEDSEALSVVAIELARRLAEYEHVGGSSPLADVVQTSAFREFVGETTDIDLPGPWARWTIVLRHHEEQA